MPSSISCATRILPTHAGHVAVKRVADGNFAEKVKKAEDDRFRSGENGRQKLETWLPRWMKFPIVLHHSQRLSRGRSVGQGPVAVCAPNAERATGQGGEDFLARSCDAAASPVA